MSLKVQNFHYLTKFIKNRKILEYRNKINKIFCTLFLLILKKLQLAD